MQQHAIRTDKDGGFVLVSKDVIADECMRIFSDRSMYKPLSPPSDFFEDIIGEYMGVVRQHIPVVVETEVEREQYLRSMFDAISPWSCAHVCSKLRFTVKTQKPIGEVTWRGIHSSVGTPFHGGMRLITHLLKPSLSKLSHLVKDSSVVVDKLKSLVIPASAHFIRIDVKDFFMSGRHSEFVESCSRYVEEAWVTAFREVLKFILASQFVASEFCPGCVYKVTSGAGMGLACSGEVCDITFYDTVESKVLSDLTSFDVHCYMRFKDDILVVLSCDRAQRLALINHRKCFSRVWSLKVECISDTECQFLDLHISKGNQWRSTGHLDVRIFHKASSQHQVLAASSLHAPHIHKTWLRGMVTRAYRLCSSKKAALHEVLHLKRMVGARMGINYAELMIPRSPPAPSHYHQFDGFTSRVILPFYRHWQFGSLAAVVRRTVDEHQDAITRILGRGIRVQLCYTLPASHLHVRLFHLSRPRNEILD